VTADEYNTPVELSGLSSLLKIFAKNHGTLAPFIRSEMKEYEHSWGRSHVRKSTGRTIRPDAG
jgi:hypothetical protein